MGPGIRTAAALLLCRGPLLVVGAIVALGAYVGSAAGLGVMALPGGHDEEAAPTPPCIPPAPSPSTACEPPTVGCGASAANAAAAPANAAASCPAPLHSLRQWRFAHYYDAPEALTALELTVMAFLRAVKAKPNWVTKVADATIMGRWATEAAAAVAAAANPPVVVHRPSGGMVTATPYRTLTPAVLAAAVAELRADAARAQTAPADAAPAGVGSVWMADALISDDEAAAVAAAAAGLAAAGPPDWHPGSGGTVRDLLHPSLYAYAAGVSRVRSAPAVRGEVPWRAFLRSGLPGGPPPSGDGVSPDYANWDTGDDVWVDGQRPEGYTLDPTGTFLLPPKKRAAHRWLPSTFGVSAAVDGCRVNTLSHYIVGLHPVRQAPVYRALEAVLARMVPLFERVLSDEDELVLDRYPINHVDMAALTADDPEVDEEAQEHAAEVGDAPAAQAAREARRAADAAAAARRDLRLRARLGALFDTRADALAAKKVDEAAAPKPVTVRLGGRRLQAVVKVARIELPAGSSYGGGTWHLEGTREEAIVATGIYYYEAENIAGSRLAFRTAYSHPAYEQEDAQGAAVVWGLVDGVPHSTSMGSIATDTPGRVVVFPNTLQHRVEPFSLADPARPGRRSIVAFFLIDPATPGGDGGLSADTVPPQDVRWLLEEEAAEAEEAAAAAAAGGAATATGGGGEGNETPLGDAPAASAAAATAAPADAPTLAGWMSPADADRHREALMEERAVRVGLESAAYEEAFSLCEH
ncbi:hypothetical protein I4F81_006362 [Pyropia yezoensis]|uniref:Uncharacterized protein n=1 Tax=Pyropia yezoensis TaxID=2788 RepID=A0ACC3C1Z7_PYRYE|nr:hypothetical protein I4F81_006362 [Neopyropia yezoensis]